MKFGRVLKESSADLPEITCLFKTYKQLKKQLKKLPEKVQISDANAQKQLSEEESHFVSALSANLTKLNEWFSSREEDAVIQLEQLERHARSVHGAEAKRDAYRMLVDFHGETLLLVHWSVLAYTATVKILKKYVKRTGIALRAPQLENLLSQPFCSTELMTQLARKAEESIQLLADSLSCSGTSGEAEGSDCGAGAAAAPAAAAAAARAPDQQQLQGKPSSSGPAADGSGSFGKSGGSRMGSTSVAAAVAVAAAAAAAAGGIMPLPPGVQAAAAAARGEDDEDDDDDDDEEGEAGDAVSEAGTDGFGAGSGAAAGAHAGSESDADERVFDDSEDDSDSNSEVDDLSSLRTMWDARMRTLKHAGGAAAVAAAAAAAAAGGAGPSGAGAHHHAGGEEGGPPKRLASDMLRRTQVALDTWSQLRNTASTPSTVLDPEHPPQPGDPLMAGAACKRQRVAAAAAAAAGGVAAAAAGVAAAAAAAPGLSAAVSLAMSSDPAAQQQQAQAQERGDARLSVTGLPEVDEM